MSRTLTLIPCRLTLWKSCATSSNCFVNTASDPTP
jgi:hypothetical protein